MVREQKQTTARKGQTSDSSISPVEQSEDVVDDISTIVVQDEEDIDSLPTMVEEIPAVSDLTPSGRLDSIRKELNPEDDTSEESTIEERMSNFFK